MKLDDGVRIAHMIEAAESAIRFCEGMELEEFLQDEKTYRAVFQCLQVIGEAANHITSAVRDEVPSIPWPKIVGMRNILVHVYFYIDVPRW